MRQLQGPEPSSQGLGLGEGPRAWLGRPGAWGPGPQGLGARAPRGLGPGLSNSKSNHFFVVLKSLLVEGWRRGGSQLKWPQMEGSGHGIPPLPPPPPRVSSCKGERKRVFTLSVTETIQHAPQGRRICATFQWKAAAI